MSDDSRPVDGVQRAFRSWQNDLDTGKRLQTVTIRSIETNADIDLQVFQLPERPAEPADT
ncbi:MAG: hypothetical protein H0W33_08750 [Gammaproteobacteria bacterium]|nr:hypothetical protein [Gammaproteobacteria bacterium]